MRRVIGAVVAVITSLALMLLGAAASAGTLATTAFDTDAPFAGANNTKYDYRFTTASGATLSRISTSLPTGTSGIGQRYLALPGVNGNDIRTPDSPANRNLQNLDLRVRVAFPTGTPLSNTALVSKWNYSSEISYVWGIGWDGLLRLTWWDTTNQQVQFTSSTNVPLASNTAKWMRATFVSNSSGSAEARFFTSDDGVTWSQLGTEQRWSGPASINQSAAPLAIGSNDNGASSSMNGKVFYAEVRNGIDGPVVNKFDPADYVTGTTLTSSSPQSEIWTINRNGSNLPADIASDLTTSNVIGIPNGGSASYRAIDGLAVYRFPTGTAIPANTPCSISFQGFRNTSIAGSYSSTISTYDNGTPPVVVDSATTSALTIFINQSNATVAVAVDPAMTFTVSPRATQCGLQSAPDSTYKYATPGSAASIDLGRISASTVGQGAHDLAVGTNANGGAKVYLRGAHAANNLRSAAAPTAFSDGGTPTPGSANFAFTVNDTNSVPGSWKALSATNTQVASSLTLGVSGQCVGFSVSAGPSTPAGVYEALVFYTAVPTF